MLLAGALCAGSMLFGLAACKGPDRYRQQADEAAYAVIDRTRRAMGHAEDGFTIEPPAMTLRRRLLLDQRLPYAGPASLGSDASEMIEQWPDAAYFTERDGIDPASVIDAASMPVLGLTESLQIAATNARDYQSQKETIYQAALALDLQRDAFRKTWTGVLDTVLSSDLSGPTDVSGIVTTDSISLGKKFETGTEFLGVLSVDLVKLLTGSRDSAYGLRLDTSISIPLLRGSGRFVVTEPLTQAERDVVYTIYDFERFKRVLAVRVASEYLGVLRQLDSVDNASENYKRVVASSRRARRLADAGRLPEIQVDQAIQDELRARNAWVSAAERGERSLDRFKLTLGLPVDARIELDREDLARLHNEPRYARYTQPRKTTDGSDQVPPADAPVELVAPDLSDAGPLEIGSGDATQIALGRRLDLRVAIGRIVDAQRGVAIGADNLRADITLLGSASLGSSRSLSTAGLDNASLRADDGRYSAMLGIDLPFERTRERNAYRNAIISFERTVRTLQALEDGVKFDIRSAMGDLLESRESIKIQAEAVRVARRRVDSTDLFLQAGRAEIRDVLEAQSSLLSAQNALTAALVRYRIAELELQRDMGVLEVRDSGLWAEYNPGEPDWTEDDDAS